MASTVLIRLEGPMQSWGLSMRGPNSAHRKTRTHPTKSGVLGLVANTLGRDWSDPIDDLAALTYAVRADRPGTLAVDYHTTGSGEFPFLPGDIYHDPTWRRRINTYQPRTQPAPYTAPAEVSTDPKTGELTGKPGLTVITKDWYLADASFLAALAGPDTLIAAIVAALSTPARTPYLGRRAYPPTHPLLAGHHTNTTDPLTVLATATRAERATTGPLPIWHDTTPTQPGADTELVTDQPTTYTNAAHRVGRLETRTHTPPAPTIPTAILDRDEFFTPDPAVNPEPTP